MCNPCNGITEYGIKCANEHFTTNKETSDGKYYCKHHHPNKEMAFGNFRSITRNVKVEYHKKDWQTKQLEERIRSLCLQIFVLYLENDFNKMHNEILPYILKTLRADETKLEKYNANTILVTNQIFEIFHGNRALEHYLD